MGKHNTSAVGESYGGSSLALQDLSRTAKTYSAFSWRSSAAAVLSSSASSRNVPSLLPSVGLAEAAVFERNVSDGAIAYRTRKHAIQFYVNSHEHTMWCCPRTVQGRSPLHAVGTGTGEQFTMFNTFLLHILFLLRAIGNKMYAERS